MNPVPRPMVFSAATILGGVCVLGLYLGLHGSIDRPYGNETVAPASSAAAAATPGVAAIEAKPVQSDLPPASSAPAKLAEAKPAPKPAASDEDQDNATVPASDVVPTHPPPEPPPLYAPDDQPSPPPQANDNAPPY